MNAREIGERIKAARVALDLSQSEVGANRLTRSFISQVERGRVIPSLRALEIIGASLNKPLGYFLDGAESRELSEIEYRLVLGHLLLLTAEPTEALRLFSDALELAQTIQNPQLLARSRYHLALGLEASSRPQEALRQAREALKTAHAHQARKTGNDCLRLIARLQHRLGKDEEAMEQIQPLVDELPTESPVDLIFLGKVLLESAEYLRHLGREAEAIIALERLQRLWDSTAQPSGILRVYRQMAMDRYNQGDLIGAISVARVGKAAALPQEHQRDRGRLLYLYGELLRGQGDVRAREYFANAARSYEAAGDALGHGQSLLAVAEELFRQGEPSQARSLAQEARLLSLTPDGNFLQAQAHWLFGRISRSAGEGLVALANLQEAVDLINPGEHPRELAAIYADMGNLLSELGRWEEANGFLAQSVQLLQGLSRPHPSDVGEA